MKTTIKIIDTILKNALIILMAALVFAVSWQVISRYVFAAPSSWTEEVARFLLIWVGVLGAAYAFRTGVHLGLDVLPKKLSGNAAQALKLFTLATVIVFAVAVLVIGGGALVALTWDLKQYSAVLGLPIAFVYSVIPVSGLLICFYAIAAALGEEIVDAEDMAQPGS
ncbi:MAG: TRAP transporter small permease [Lysobacterales bacterium]|jgi:TRAP-type C4-dicarboxylate transport system permease small subunit